MCDTPSPFQVTAVKITRLNADGQPTGDRPGYHHFVCAEGMWTIIRADGSWRARFTPLPM